MSLKELQDAVKETAMNIWATIGNPTLPREDAIAFIEQTIYGLLNKEVEERSGYMKSTLETVTKLRQDCEAVGRLIQEKDARIAQLETEKAGRQTHSP
jgi:hypothetical protein